MEAARHMYNPNNNLRARSLDPNKSRGKCTTENTRTNHTNPTTISLDPTTVETGIWDIESQVMKTQIM